MHPVLVLDPTPLWPSGTPPIPLLGRRRRVLGRLGRGRARRVVPEGSDHAPDAFGAREESESKGKAGRVPSWSPRDSWEGLTVRPHLRVERDTPVCATVSDSYF